MVFNLNDHYHPLLLQQAPDGARTAQDVGRGTGKLARLLARTRTPSRRGRRRSGRHRSGASSRGRPCVPPGRRAGGPVAQRALRLHLVHRQPSPHAFETLLPLREALAPGGVLAVLGLYPVRTATDLVWALPARCLLKADRLLNRGRPTPGVQVPIVWPPPLSYAETRAAAARLLPGSTLRRLLFWRYLLVYRA
jgi:hypothetical protein